MMMKRLMVCSSLVVLAACGSDASGGSGGKNDDSDDPVIIDTGDNNDDGSANNGTPNNGTPNNGTPNNGTNNDTSNNDTPNNDTPNNTTPSGELALLGNGEHTLDSVQFSVVADSSASLGTPRDLAFHPNRPGELWVLNLDDNSTVVFDDATADDPASQRYAGFGKDHFMARPAALAFGENGNFASAHEEDEKTQGPNGTPADFMGPSLWTSDRSIYDGGHEGHLDMLHNSPNAVGIAWERDNRYWVFDGYHQSITMYDFHDDHGPGGTDHSDGEVARYVEGEVGYVDDVPSHLEFNQDDGLLYIADTANNRIATLDPETGEMGQRIDPNYDGGAQYAMNGGDLLTLVEGSDVMLEVPSGLEIHDGHIFVTDNSKSLVVAIDTEGNLVDYLDLSEEVAAGGLMGMAFANDGTLFLVDAADSRILRIAPKDDDASQ